MNDGRALVRRAAALPVKTKLIATFVLVALVGVVTTAFGVTRDTRVVLFATPLHPDQRAEVEQRLAAWGVPFAASSDNVRVAAARRSELLLKLALAGVPHAHLATSDEALRGMGALTPQSVLEAQTREALAADLASGLRGLDGVADARVVIAASSGGIYADEPRRDATASVRITLAPGRALAPRTLAGIRAFVAGGVPGLDPERVAIVDDRGLALEGSGGADDTALQTALQSALDGAFGAGTTIVRVHRETLGERRDIRHVRRAPLAGALARTESDERYAGTAKKYSKSSATEDRGSDVADERRSAGPDATARLSVAVAVDASRAQDVAKIRALAAATAGVDERRGDIVTVEAVRFSSPAAGVPSVPLALVALGTLSGVLPHIIAAAGIVLVLALGARPALALATRVVERADVAAARREAVGLPPGRLRGALAGEPPHVAAAVISALPAATAAAVLELYPAEERAQIVRRLRRESSPLVPTPEELIRGR